ncbi:MAG: S-layer homology domain-containing protein, partial [Clostridia bacterium]|nr:S-layer homology domain-containing protein [Clostridia bacterium]
LNRATFVTILGRLAGIDTSKYTKSSFIDVPLDSSTSWYAPYVEWANERGIILGYGNGKFGPLDPITREQVYIILYRYMIFVENRVPQVSTVRISASDKSDLWQDDTTQNAVKFATANDLLLLNNGYIKPKQEAKRWELASILMDFCVNVLGMPGNE